MKLYCHVGHFGCTVHNFTNSSIFQYSYFCKSCFESFVASIFSHLCQLCCCHSRLDIFVNNVTAASAGRSTPLGWVDIARNCGCNGQSLTTGLTGWYVAHLSFGQWREGICVSKDPHGRKQVSSPADLGSEHSR